DGEAGLARIQRPPRAETIEERGGAGVVVHARTQALAHVAEVDVARAGGDGGGPLLGGAAGREAPGGGGGGRGRAAPSRGAGAWLALGSTGPRQRSRAGRTAAVESRTSTAAGGLRLAHAATTSSSSMPGASPSTTTRSGLCGRAGVGVTSSAGTQSMRWPASS